MDNKRRLTNKYILLAILLIAVFVLPSCRTRISNNSEITTVQYDESGFMSEDYQMRRDELGLSTAEKPLLPNFGSGESDDSEDFEEGESIDYNPEDYQEDFTEPETNTNTNTNTNRTTTGTRTHTTTPTRRSSDGTTTTRYNVTFDANGGKISDNGKETMKIKVKKGGTLGPLPKATKDGDECLGWYTSKSGGSKVDSKTKVSGSTTLYAHYPEKKPDPPTPPQKCKVSVDVKGGEITGDIKPSYKKGESFNLPGAEKTGYKLKSWKVNGSSKKVGSKVTVNGDLKIVAEWEIAPVDYWNAKIADSDESCTYIADENGALIQDCKGNSVDSNPDFTIGFVKIDATKEDVKNAANSIKDFGGKVLILSNPPKRDSKEELVYKFCLYEELYGEDLGISGVEKETGVKREDVFISFDIPADEGDGDGDGEGDGEGGS